MSDSSAGIRIRWDDDGNNGEGKLALGGWSWGGGDGSSVTAGEAEEQWPEGGADINDGYKFQQLFDVCLNFQNKDLGSVLPVKPSIRQPFSELRITVRWVFPDGDGSFIGIHKM